MRSYERRALTRGEEVRAAGIAAAAGASLAVVVLYFARLFLQREG